MSRFPLVYIVQKDAAGNVVPIPAEGLLLENLTPEGGRLRTDGEGRALELPPSLLEYAAAHQKPMRRAGVRNVRTTITLRSVLGRDLHVAQARALEERAQPRGVAEREHAGRALRQRRDATPEGADDRPIGRSLR